MKRKGISLIVLIITIVVIIILGTAIIVNIAKTNIINNANEAVLKSDVANLKSELEIYVTDQFVSNKGKYDRQNLNADVGQAKYNEENIEDKNKDGKTNIYDILSSLKKSSLDEAVYIQEGKILFIRSKFNAEQLKLLAKMGEEIDGTPKITDIVSTSDFTSITVSADVTNPEEVEKYIYILNGGEGIETKESSKTFEGLEPGTKYTVTIKALLKDGTEIEMVKEISTLDNTPPTEPIINSSYGYPLITLNGVIDGGKTTILYDTTEGVINEYSLDGGTTWAEYKGSFNISQTCKIMAKSTKLNGLESSVTKEIIMPNDAMPDTVYDGKDNSSIGHNGKNYYMIIDESFVGGTINVKGYRSGTPTVIKILDSKNKELYTIDPGLANNYDINIDIPEGAYKVCTSGGDSYTKLNEISLVKNPKYISGGINPYITGEKIGIKIIPFTVKYSGVSMKKLYKIDDGEWEEYNDEPIEINRYSTLYVKSIFRDGSESEVISTGEIELSADKIGDNAYDEDETSFYLAGNKADRYIYVEPSAWGKSIRILSKGYQGIFYYNESNTVIDSEDYFRTTDNTITIPEGTTYIRYYFNENGGIYDMKLID